jgi:type IV pilus assembly protein PilC
MPSFEWKGKMPNGKAGAGTLVADNREAAGVLLRRQNIQVTNLRERDKKIPIVPKFGGKVPEKKVSIFTRQFSVMLDAGLPLVQCLEILGGQEDHKGFKRIIEATRGDVEGGMSLAEAMRRHPLAFDNLYVNMIAAGEAGGILDIILQRLSTYIEKSVKLKSQVKSALIYPVAVMLIAAGVVYVILWKVIPVFAQMFASLDAAGSLPPAISSAHIRSGSSSAWPPSWWPPSSTTPLTTARDRSTGSCCVCRSSACCYARSPSLASAVPWRP